jgi:hypothetical protein
MTKNRQSGSERDAGYYLQHDKRNIFKFIFYVTGTCFYSGATVPDQLRGVNVNVR